MPRSGIAGLYSKRILLKTVCIRVVGMCQRLHFLIKGILVYVHIYHRKYEHRCRYHYRGKLVHCKAIVRIRDAIHKMPGKQVLSK